MNRPACNQRTPTSLPVLTVVFFAVLHILCAPLNAQTFTTFHPPTHLCAGQSETVTFGMHSHNSVVVAVPQATLSSADTAFLPDGENCPPHGCSYRSPITFTDFPAGSHISSVNDIRYVRLNIEHSFIGDIYINITCPNGQKADLMRFGGDLNSECSDAIPTSSIDWLDGDNLDNGLFFGDPYDDEDSETCDRYAPDNQPGIGWNYCWSSNTGSGFSYAPGDGIIYRETNTSDDVSVDSSDVANLSNFYHPDENFSSLIGCPLNGSWYIEVVDGWGGDNGYIFEWELSLDPSLLPYACDLQSRTVSGSIAQRINDSTYTLSAPASLARDTTVDVLFRAVSTCGDTIDSIAHITLHTPPTVSIDSTVCDSIIIGGTTYRTSQPLVSHLTTVHGCDSTLQMNLTVKRSTVYDTVVVAVGFVPPTYIGGQLFTDEVQDSLITGLTNADGCDSSIRLTIHLRHVWHTAVDTTLCEHQLPLSWNGRDISAPDQYVDTLTTRFGEDSIVTLTLHVNPDSRTVLRDTVVENQLPVVRFGSLTFSSSTDTTILYQNQWFCDSTVEYHLKVWPNYNASFDTLICGDPHTVVWHGVTFSQSADTLLQLTSVHGADSNTRLTVTMGRSYIVALDTTLCQGDTARKADMTFVRDTTLYQPLLTQAGCDSITDIRVRFTPSYELRDSLSFCPDLPLTYMDSIYPHTVAFDTLLHTSFGCDSLVHVKLQRIDSLFAVGMLVGDSTVWSGDTTLTGCPPYRIFLRDTTPQAALWQWEFGDGDTARGSDIVAHTYDSTGFFTPWLKVVSEHGCRDSAKIDSALWVMVRPTAAFDWAERYPGNHKPETQFRNLSQPDTCTYLWEIQSLGTTGYDTTSAINPFFNWSNGTDLVPAGNYEVRLIAYWSHMTPDSLVQVCTDTVSDTVTIINTFLEFPNLVSPDGDGYNDRWEVVNLVEVGIYTMSEVWIYNAWGTQVFHGRDMARSEDFWDPNQTNSPDGTYYFRFTARSRYGVVKRNGTIEVVRGSK